jgi:hypothetical protein
MRSYVGGGTGVFVPIQGGITSHLACSMSSWLSLKKKCRVITLMHRLPS